jgi:hypothetical protein
MNSPDTQIDMIRGQSAGVECADGSAVQRDLVVPVDAALGREMAAKFEQQIALGLAEAEFRALMTCFPSPKGRAPERSVRARAESGRTCRVSPMPW